jgi:hypothetical protein
MWVQVLVQLKKEKWLPIFRKRHQIGHLDFRSSRLLTEGRYKKTRNWDSGGRWRMEKLVSNSSPKLGHFRAFFEGVETGKARQAKGFSVLASFLTR